MKDKSSREQGSRPDPRRSPARARTGSSRAGSPVPDSPVQYQDPDALKENEAVLRSFFDSAGVMRGIVEVVAEDDVRHITDNAVTASFFGLTPGDMKNKLGSELGDPREILQMWVSHCTECKKSGKAVTFEYMDPRGTPETWLLATVSYLGTPSGGFPRYAYVILDITGQKRAEAELRKSEERLSLAQTAADAGTWDWDILTGKIVWSPHLFSLFGIDPGQAASFDSWEQAMHPDDRAAARTRIDEALARHAALDSEYRIIRPDGAIRWINARGQGVYDSYGNPVRMSGICIDITRRREAEAALRESEERMRFALEISRTGAWDLDLGDHTSCRSLDHDRIFGYETVLPEWTYEMFLSHVLPEDRAVVDSRFRHATETGGDWNFECRIRRRDGVIRWIWAAGRHRPGSAGGAPRMAGIVQDITERKEAEEALRESRNKFQSLIETSIDFIWEIDRQGRYTYCSPQMQTLWGIDPEKMIGKSPFDLMPPHERERAQERFRKISGSHDQIRGLEFSAFNGDGNPVFLEISSVPFFDAGGVLQGYRGISRDITEQKRAQEAMLKARDELEIRVEDRTAELNAALASIRTERHRLYDVLDSLPVYVCLLDDDYRMPFANKYFRENFREPEGRRCYDFLFNRTEPCEVCETYTVMKTRVPHHWYWTGPNGKDYDIYDFPFTDSDGSFKILEMGIDITDRKKAEEKLSVLASIVAHTDDAIIGKTLDGIIVSWNAGAEKMYGYSAEEATGRHISMLQPPEEKYDIEYIMDRIRNGEPVLRYTTTRLRKDGKSIHVALTISPIKDLNGRVIGASTIARDITEQQKAREKIENAYAYNRSLIEASLDPLVTISPGGTISDVNEATIRITGFTREQLIGTDFSDYFTEPARAKAGYEKVFRDGSVTDYPLEIRHRDGQVTPVLYNASVYRDPTGKVTGVFAAARDVTERKKAEEMIRKEQDLLEERVNKRTAELAEINARHKEEISQRRRAESLVKKTISELQAAIESTADGIYAVDRSGKISRYNQNFASMWKIPDELLQSGEDSRVSEYMRTQVKNPGLVSNITENVHDRDHEVFDMLELNDGRIFERYSKPQKMESAIIGRVMSYRDITDRRRAEEKLLASLEEKETLIREIHHRVKNNLQIISGLLDMTRMRTADRATNSILTDMMLKIKTMAQIHTRLYESKQFDRINMGSQIREQVADLTSIYGQSGARILTDIEIQDVYLPVDQAIPCALIVNEILSNSFKHAFKGKKEGILNVSAARDDGNMNIIIRDNGIGIPPDVDFRKTTSLGLKLIRNLALQLGGSVTITSRHGTEVTVEFPLRQGGA